MRHINPKLVMWTCYQPEVKELDNDIPFQDVHPNRIQFCFGLTVHGYIFEYMEVTGKDEAEQILKSLGLYKISAP